MKRRHNSILETAISIDNTQHLVNLLSTLDDSSRNVNFYISRLIAEISKIGDKRFEKILRNLKTGREDLAGFIGSLSVAKTHLQELK